MHAGVNCFVMCVAPPTQVGVWVNGSFARTVFLLLSLLTMYRLLSSNHSI